MKNTFNLNGLNITIEGQPIAIDKLEVTSEMSAQELATSGGLIKALVGELKPLITEAVKPVVTPANTAAPTTNRNYKNNYKNKVEKPETKNITKEWRKISVPEELKPEGNDKYRWCSSKEYYGDSVSVDGSTYGVVYIHMYAMKRKSFIIIRNNEVRYEDDIKREDFHEFLENIKIPENIKNYIIKVVALG
jgi:hypothetical protein